MNNENIKTKVMDDVKDNVSKDKQDKQKAKTNND